MSELLTRVDSLRVYQRGGRRAPHKPLLLLVALARLQQGKARLAPYEELREPLLRLLVAYAPPVRGRHQPELPYWHLRSDGLWEIPDAEVLPLQRGRFPLLGALKETVGGFRPEWYSALRENPRLVEEVARRLLGGHFPESLHAGLLAAVGLDLDSKRTRTEPEGTVVKERPSRDPDFPRDVLRAYEHRCAVTGFRAALGGSYFGVEAAHVKWHAYGGPDEVENGLVLNPLLHVLFDRGAWSLTDDRRVLVSVEFTGSDEAERTVRSLHGRELRAPLAGHEPVAVEYIQWHREPDRGGVFRAPALQLDR